MKTPKRKKEAEETNEIELNTGFCENPEISTPIDEIRGSYRKYTPIFKLQIIEEAKKTSI